MRKYISLVALSVLMLIGCGGKSKVEPVILGKPALFTRVMMLDGTIRAKDELRGKKTALLFWATWCNNSRSIVEKFAALAKQHPEVRFMAVSLDKEDDLDKLQGRIASQHLEGLEHVFTGNQGYDEMYYALSGETVPYLALLDENVEVIAAGGSLSVIEDALEPVEESE